MSIPTTPATPADPAEIVRRVSASHVLERELLAQLTEDAQVRVPSPLPGWTRAHVLSSRLVFLRAALRQIQYAMAGETIAFYRAGPDPRAADKAARDEELTANAVRPGPDLVHEVCQATAVLDDSWSRLAPHDWRRRACYRGGGTLHDVLLASWRECEVHRVDYDLGVRPKDWSEEFCLHVLDYLSRRVPEGKCLRLSTPEGRNWVLGSGEETVELRGALPDLAAWLGGREPDGPLTGGDGGPAPDLGRFRAAPQAA